MIFFSCLTSKKNLKLFQVNRYKNKKVKNSLGSIACLDLSFRYKGKDRLVSTNGDDVFNDFVVIEKPKADLVLGLPWLWLREAKIDMEKQGLTIYGDFVPFCEETDSSESKETNDSNHAGLKQ